MKRYIYIIIGIVVVAALAIAALLYIKDRSAVSGGGTTTTTGSLPPVGTQGTTGSGGNGTTTTGSGSSGTTGPGGTSASAGTGVQAFGMLSNDPVLDYFVGAGNTITAIEPTGEIVSIAGGQSTTINSSTINDIISASFSYDGRKILVSFGDPANPQSSVFDIISETWTALPQGLQSPRWSSSSYQIAYFSTTAGGKLALSILNAANLKTAPSTLLTLAASDLDLQWVSKNQFVLSDKPTSYDNGSIWLFNAQTNALSALVYEAPGLEGLWSNNTSTPYGLVFFDGPAGQSPTLQLQALYGNAPTQALSLLTLPSKCLFNTEPTPSSTALAATSTATKAAGSSTYLALYCGIPRTSSGFSSARLPDDYETMALFTSDDIYKINTATGDTQVLWSDQTQNMDVSDMKLFNGTLFFINRYDQKLYGLTFSQ